MLDVRSWVAEDSLQHTRGLYWLFARVGSPGRSEVFWRRLVVFGPSVLWIREACCFIWDGKLRFVPII